MNGSIEIKFKTHAEEFDSAFETDLIKDFMEFMKSKGCEWSRSEMKPVEKLNNGLCKWQTILHFHINNEETV